MRVSNLWKVYSAGAFAQASLASGRLPAGIPALEHPSKWPGRYFEFLRSDTIPSTLSRHAEGGLRGHPPQYALLAAGHASAPQEDGQLTQAFLRHYVWPRTGTKSAAQPHRSRPR